MNLQTAIFNSKQIILGFVGQPPLLCHAKKGRSLFCSEECQPGDYFKCLRCHRLMPFCMGANDSFEDWCDNCAQDYATIEGGFPNPEDAIV